MHVARRAGHPEVDDDMVLTYGVGGPFADNVVIVKDYNATPLHDAKPGLSHRMGAAMWETFSTNR
jgi:hypothetical protein